MRHFAIIALALLGCAVAQQGINTDRLFNQYAGSDNIMSRAEFDRFWRHFDEDDDGTVTKQEFDRVWRREGYPNPQSAPLFFELMDRVPDEVLNSLDFPHLFNLFDEDGDGVISLREFRFNFQAYFD